MMLEIVQKTGQGIRFYHPDHLGSTTVVTDLDGEVTQNVAYIPYGEVFVEQRNGVWNTPYLFTAKKLDEETGLYYYGARYLDPTHAAWLSVGPLFEKYVGMTPYGYCAGNPVGLVDPNGMAGEESPSKLLFGWHGNAKDVKCLVLQQKRQTRHQRIKNSNPKFSVILQQISD